MGDRVNTAMDDKMTSGDLDDGLGAGLRGLSSFAGGESSMMDGKAANTHELVTIASLGVGAKPGLPSQGREESKMGLSSSFMLADARPAPRAVPSIRDVSASLEPSLRTPAGAAPSARPPTGRHNFAGGADPPALRAMDDDDVAPELGPSAHAPGNSGGRQLPGEVMASWNSDPNSPHGASPMHTLGDRKSVV